MIDKQEPAMKSSCFEVTQTVSGFEQVEHPDYNDVGITKTLILQSRDPMCLWFGRDHYLNSGQVADLVRHLSHWLETGSLDLEKGEQK